MFSYSTAVMLASYEFCVNILFLAVCFVLHVICLDTKNNAQRKKQTIVFLKRLNIEISTRNCRRVVVVTF